MRQSHAIPHFVSLFLIATTSAAAQTVPMEDPAKLKEKPITTAGGKAGELLRQWWKEGDAAGNIGDYYDNRDGGHSDLGMDPYPQLQKIVYSPEDIKLRKHWAAQRVLLPHVVFGNSSTSAPPTQGGSNPRMYYTVPAALDFLHKQYTGNNLYIYPEHRDHDPGHNGVGDGFGDLYPTNTPYLIISQGSSGSDQPFMRALPFTLAAFRPEVKKKLVETGLLMPTVQMLLRRTNKHLKDPKEYLTGKAHPTVFEGSWVDELALVQAAHAITLDDIPPMVQLKVLEEDRPVPGKDFCDVHNSERLADTPAVIARIWRGKEQKRRLVVSAEASYDVNKKPLTFSWVVLRGDESRIKFTPTKAGSAAEITIAYHERRPVAAGSSMESNRVDLGVFVHNGVYYSAPAFITFFALDNEARTYDAKGRIVEIGQGMGTSRVSVSNWGKLLEDLGSSASVAGWLELKPSQQEAFATAAAGYGKLEAQRNQARSELERAQKEKKEAELKKGELQKKLADAEKRLQDFLGADQAALGKSLRAFTEERLHRLQSDQGLFKRYWLQATKKDVRPILVENLHRQLVQMGLLKHEQAGPPDLQFLAGKATAYEGMLLERANAAILTQALFPGMLTSSQIVNFVDQRLAAPKSWRDVFRYDDKGNYLGWTRYGSEKPQDFNADGHLIVEKDKLGRCTKARLVKYVQSPPLKKLGLNDNPLRVVVEDTVISYEYANDQERRGKEKSRDKVEHKP